MELSWSPSEVAIIGFIVDVVKREGPSGGETYLFAVDRRARSPHVFWSKSRFSIKQMKKFSRTVGTCVLSGNRNGQLEGGHMLARVSVKCLGS